MISNKDITEKLKEKTKGDKKALDAILQFLEIEEEHKQYNKPYKTIIENDVKEGVDANK